MEKVYNKKEPKKNVYSYIMIVSLLRTWEGFVLITISNRKNVSVAKLVVIFLTIKCFTSFTLSFNFYLTN